MNSDLIKMFKTDNEVYNGIIKLAAEVGLAVCEYYKEKDHTVFISRGIDIALFKRLLSREELSNMLKKFLKGEYELLKYEPAYRDSQMGAYASSIGKTVDDGAVLIKRIDSNIYCCFNFEK